jgi:serine/threonine protein phosphatase 1
MKSSAPDSAQRFATLRNCPRIWAISSIHADLGRLQSIHDAILGRLRPRDGLVYLGNMTGVGTSPHETIAELLDFRCRFIGRPGSFAADLVFLRGSQEEMLHKLLELQFAPNPGEVLRWMLEHGIEPVLAGYRTAGRQGLAACREGPLAITRWTASIRGAINAAPGHAALLTALRRAAFTAGGELLFVHAGIDPARPLAAQQDQFWWGGRDFLSLAVPYEGFRKIVRGFDRQHAGLRNAAFSLSVDRGCGFGGPLACVCIGLDGAILESFEA